MRAAVDASGQLLPNDLVFAAMPEGDKMRVTFATEARDPRFGEIRISRGRGLGGQVLDRRQPMCVEDYAHDGRITSDFVDIVSGGEGLHGILCVPVLAPDGEPVSLLYAAQRAVGGFGGRAIKALQEIASFAEIGIENAQQRARELELERLRDRQRIAGRLHDSVAQALFAIGVTAKESIGSGDVDARLSALEEIDTAAANARAQLRESLRYLDDSPEALAFDARLEGELRLFERRSDCAVRIVRRGEPAPVPESIEQLVLEMILEGLRNAVKYEHAKLALVYLDYRDHELRATVQSEHGGAVRGAPLIGAGTGFGLSTLEQRARRLGGSLELEAPEGENRVLRLQLPFLAMAA
jgi:signal transduction histidine kinase